MPQHSQQPQPFDLMLADFLLGAKAAGMVTTDSILLATGCIEIRIVPPKSYANDMTETESLSPFLFRTYFVNHNNDYCGTYNYIGK